MGGNLAAAAYCDIPPLARDISQKAERLPEFGRGGFENPGALLGGCGAVTSLLMIDEAPEYGPAMAALNERQRKFVLAMVETPGCSHAEAARLAGYSDVADGAKVRGHYCAHNPAVQDAIREEAGKRLHSASLIAANVVVAMLTDAAVPAKEKLRAAGMLLDRTGFAAEQNINVNKTVTDRTGRAMVERIEKLARALGVDPAALLGVNASVPKLIEAKAVDSPAQD